MSDVAPLGSYYTYRVIGLAVRLVVENGLPYRAAGVTVPGDCLNFRVAARRKWGCPRERLPFSLLHSRNIRIDTRLGLQPFCRKLRYQQFPA